MTDGVIDVEDDDEVFFTNEGPFRDGHFWVLSEKCATCIFRPGNLMHLREGARDSMVQGCLDENTFIPCHETLDLDRGRSVCRGFYDLHRADTAIIRLATSFSIIAFDAPPTKDQD